MEVEKYFNLQNLTNHANWTKYQSKSHNIVSDSTSDPLLVYATFENTVFNIGYLAIQMVDSFFGKKFDDMREIFANKTEEYFDENYGELPNFGKILDEKGFWDEKCAVDDPPDDFPEIYHAPKNATSKSFLNFFLEFTSTIIQQNSGIQFFFGLVTTLMLAYLICFSFYNHFLNKTTMQLKPGQSRYKNNKKWTFIYIFIISALSLSLFFILLICGSLLGQNGQLKLFAEGQGEVDDGQGQSSPENALSHHLDDFTKEILSMAVAFRFNLILSRNFGLYGMKNLVNDQEIILRNELSDGIIEFISSDDRNYLKMNHDTKTEIFKMSDQEKQYLRILINDQKSLNILYNHHLGKNSDQLVSEILDSLDVEGLIDKISKIKDAFKCMKDYLEKFKKHGVKDADYDYSYDYDYNDDNDVDDENNQDKQIKENKKVASPAINAINQSLKPFKSKHKTFSITIISICVILFILISTSSFFTYKTAGTPNNKYKSYLKHSSIIILLICLATIILSVLSFLYGGITQVYICNPASPDNSVGDLNFLDFLEHDVPPFKKAFGHYSDLYKDFTGLKFGVTDFLKKCFDFENELMKNSNNTKSTTSRTTSLSEFFEFSYAFEHVAEIRMNKLSRKITLANIEHNQEQIGKILETYFREKNFTKIHLDQLITDTKNYITNAMNMNLPRDSNTISIKIKNINQKLLRKGTEITSKLIDDSLDFSVISKAYNIIYSIPCEYILPNWQAVWLSLLLNGGLILALSLVMLKIAGYKVTRLTMGHGLDIPDKLEDELRALETS